MELQYLKNIPRSTVEAVWRSPRLATPIRGPVFPDANQDFLLYEGEAGTLRAAVFGPLSKPIDVTLLPGVRYCGIRFRPGHLPINKLPGLRRTRAADIVDERIDIDLPSVFSIDSPLGVVAWLTQTERRVWPALMLALEKYSIISVEAFAAKAGYSNRQLERICHENTGLTPKRLLRLVRFQRAFKALQQDPRQDLGCLALVPVSAETARKPH